MECVLAFSYDSPEWGGAPRTIGVGTKLRADHEAVRVGGANHCVSPDTPDDERPRMEDFIGDGVQTVHRPVPDGWRRDLHGHGRPFDQQ